MNKINIFQYFINLTRKFKSILISIYWKIQVTNIKHKVKEKKNKADKLDYKYNSSPDITFIVQFFNKRQNLKLIIERLKLAGQELIVIDDGSVDDSYIDLMKLLDKPNEFILRSNDLFEVRTYDRAIGMARGKFVCLLQDDDIPPHDIQWVENAMTLFKIFPDLLILGGRDGSEILIPEETEEKSFDYQIVDEVAQRPGFCKLKMHRKPLYQESSTGIPFMFTMTVNRAPVFLRRKEFIKLGGINQEFAPYQCDDIDYCIRAWLAGYRVGFSHVSFDRNVNTGGMRLFNSGIAIEQEVNHWIKIYQLYNSEIASGYLNNLVEQQNLVLKKIT